MATIKFIFFLAQLIINLLYSTASLITFYLKHLVKKHQISVLIYSLVVIQLLLLSIQVANISLPDSEAINLDLNQLFFKENLNSSLVKLYSLDASKDNALKELGKYQAWDKKQPSHRDLLINQALLHLSLGNKEKYELYLMRAKKVDPNWIGW